VKGKGGGMPPPVAERLRRSRVEGGSGWIIPVPPVGYRPCDGPPASASASASAAEKGEKKMPAGGTPSASAGGEKSGGVLVLGTSQITYHSTAEGTTKVLPIQYSIITACVRIDPPPPPDARDVGGAHGVGTVGPTVQFLITDEKGRMHVLAITRGRPPPVGGGGGGDAVGGGAGGKVTGLHLHTLGETTVAECLVYLRAGIVFIGSTLGDSQLVQILDRPLTSSTANNTNTTTTTTSPSPETTTHVHVLEELPNLGPISDFDIVPTTHSPNAPPRTGGRVSEATRAYLAQRNQSTVVTASGVGKDGTLRLVRNGVGMEEYASVELGGIQRMWSVRGGFGDGDDAFLVQSYVGETRVLGVAVEVEDGDGDREEGIGMDDGEEEEEEECTGGTLEERVLPGLDSDRSTLYAGNVAPGACEGCSESLLLQITEVGVRIIDTSPTPGGVNPLCT